MNKTLMRIAPLAALLVNSLLACAAPAAESEQDALGAAIHRWTAAANAQDAATLNRTMTEDVELIDGAATVKGRAAAIRALRELVKHGRLAAMTREITIDNDVAWHVAGIAQILRNGDVRGAGTALEIWKRVNGEWQLHRRL